MVTFAAATTPPVVSVIVPWMFPVATVLCAYSGTTAPTRIKVMKTTDTTILTFVEVPRSMLSHPRKQNECSRISSPRCEKDILLVLRGQLGLQRTDGCFYLLVEKSARDVPRVCSTKPHTFGSNIMYRVHVFDILLWSSELAAKRSVFR
jgi:hypothetical protein